METQSNPSVVDALLVGMIQRWPTLRQTRNDALYALCTKTTEYGDEIEWDADGNIAFSPRSGEFHPSVDKSLEEEEAEIRARFERGDRISEQLMASDILFRRREHAKKTFTRDNADLIVAKRDYSFVNTIPDYNAFRFLKEIPAHANPAWIEAFVQLAKDIIAFKYPAGKFDSMAPGYADRYLSNLESAQKNAREFLTLVNGSDTEKRELARSKFEAEMEALKARAAKAGVTIDATVK